MKTQSRYLAGNFHVIAHRGGSFEAPENTLCAFENAHTLSQEIIFELDVRRTRDGEVVVIHDPTVDRTTNGHGNIRDLTLSEIKKLDAAYHFTNDGGTNFPHRGGNIKIPTLKEVLEKFPQARASIEIKHANPHFEDQVVKIIQEAKASERICLASENYSILTRARAAGPQMCSGFSGRELLITLICNRPGLTSFLPTAGNVYQTPIRHSGLTIFSPKLLQMAHSKNLAVHVWTINDEKIMAHLIKLGVDGIITDAPSLLLRVARELKKI